MQSKITSGVLGAIIAGGRSTRMGVTAKMRSELVGKPILRHITDRFAPQVERLMLNTNGDPGWWDDYDVDVVPDALPGHLGPLSGLLTVMDWAQAQLPTYPWVATVPSDTPFLPLDLVRRLILGIDMYPDAEAVVAQSGGHRHPVVGLFPTSMADDLRSFLDGGERKTGLWIDRIGAPAISFSDQPVDPFFNINTAEELAEAETLARQNGTS